MDNFIEIYEDYIKVREATKKGYAIARGGDSINLEQPNSKTRRGRVGCGIANTLTCSCNQGVMVEMNKERGIKRMWKNELKKYEFNMDEVRVFDVFAGIGSLHQSLKDLGVPVRITNLSEIDIDATISYAAGHIENFKDLEFEYPSDTEMKEWLMARNIGYSYEKNKSSVPRLKKEKLKLAYKASLLLNNLGDIAKIDYNEIEDFDLMNFSFSCTDLSNAGKQKGMKNEDGTPTRSGLYVYGIKAIKAKRPKYIMIENVKGLIQKKFIDDFYSIVKELNEVGYNCYYPTKTDKKQNEIPICLNAKDFGIPQNRERIFVICIRKDIDDGTFEFPVGKDQGIRLKDVLEDEVDEKYYLKEVKNFFIKNSFDMEAKGNGFRFKPHTKNKANCAFTLTTRCGARMDDNFIIDKDNEEPICEFSSKNASLKDIELSEMFHYAIRKLTSLECWRLMGFPDENFYKAKELGISDSQMYKQAGNSIVVNVLYYIFKNLFKKYIVE